ncbi:MAG: c-type cytochrome, partial [Acidobacteriia bacterium]|nr:c-type cytochrome [Terriglobia bacterium]
LHTYGFFGHVKHSGVTGGHLVVGGTVYDADVFPQTFHQSFIGANFLGHSASWWRVKPRGSTFEARQVGTLLDSNDTWFSPTDLALGPDGSMYISDFHDKRTAHPDPDAEWDRSNGRVYKIEAKNAKPAKNIDLERLSSAELVDRLRNPNGWYAFQARRILAHRRDKGIHEDLRNGIVEAGTENLALQNLWALHVSGGLDDDVAADLLSHPAEYVRAWTVRLLGDRRRTTPPLAEQLSVLARRDQSVVVRSQLAASAKRLPGRVALPMLSALLERELDARDPHVPLLIWWALESKALSDSGEMVRLFTQPGTWAPSMKRDNVLRLIRRYAAEGTAAGYDAALELARAAPASHLETTVRALDQGLAERGATLSGLGQGGLFEEVAAVKGDPVFGPRRPFQEIASPLRRWIRKTWTARPQSLDRTRLAVRAGIDEAYRATLSGLEESDTHEDRRVALLDLLRDLGRSDCIRAVLAQRDLQSNPTVRLRALDVLARFESDEVSERLLNSYPQVLSAEKEKIRGILLSRRSTAGAFLEAVEQGVFPAADVAVTDLRQLPLFRDEAIDALVQRHWGNIRPGSTEEKLAVMRRYRNDLNTGEGDPQSLDRTRLAVRAGIDEAYRATLSGLEESDTHEDRRVALLDLLRDLGRSDCIRAVLAQRDLQSNPTVRLRALDVLARFESDEVSERLLNSYPQVLSAEKEKIRGILLSRRSTAGAFLEAVEQGVFPAADVAVTDLRQLPLFRDEAIDALVQRHWGNIRPGSTEEKLAVMRRYRNDLNTGEGDPRRGQLLFIEHCASCHRLFGEGGTLGNDLTGANRSDRAALLAALVDPSATVRTGYLTYTVRTQSGRTVRGIVEQEDAAGVTLIDSTHQKTRITRSDIRSMEIAPESIMPENLLDRLDTQEVRDLFSYLQKDAP